MKKFVEVRTVIDTKHKKFRTNVSIGTGEQALLNGRYDNHYGKVIITHFLPFKHLLRASEHEDVQNMFDHALAKAARDAADELYPNK